MANTSKKVYNKEEYVQAIELYTLNPKKSEDILVSLNLFNDNIKEIKIINDLLTATPKLIVLFEDVGTQEISKYKSDGYTFLRLYITYKDRDTNSDLKFFHDFIVNDIKLINKKSESTVYEISGYSFFQAYWKGNIIYSSGKEVKAATKIIEEMLIAGKLLKPGTKKHKDLTQSANKFHYIAPTNAPLKACIDDILAYTVDTDTGIYYVGFRLLDNEPFILSLNDIYNEPLKYAGKYNYIFLNNEDSFEILEKSVMDFESMNYIHGAENYDLIKPITLTSYDYTKRNWSEDVYDFKRFDKISPTQHNTQLEKNYKELPETYSKKIKQYEVGAPIHYGSLRERIHKLNILGDVIQFKCIGNMKREVGQICVIDSKAPLFIDRYKGLWMIERVTHIYTGQTYINDCIAVRVEKIKPNSNKK